MPQAEGTKCRSCGTPIFYAKTEKGKDCPYDAKPRDEDLAAKVYVYAQDDKGVMRRQTHGHQSHWATCPSREQHRKTTNPTSVGAANPPIGAVFPEAAPPPGF